MGWKFVLVACLVILWIVWPKIRIPRNNFFRRKLGAFATYFLIIMILLVVLQLLDYLLSRSGLSY